MTSRSNNSKTITWLLLTPWIVSFLVFWAYPLLYAFYLSFTKYKTLSNEAIWIGLKNYEKLINDTVFWQALENTTIFVIGTLPFTMALALLFAALLMRVESLRNFYRSSLFLPSVTSLVVLALIFTNLYSFGGYINLLLQSLGLPFPEKGWLQEPNLALPAIMIMDIWASVGYYAVLFLAAMQNVSKDYYEVADLEGTGAWKQFWNITLPLIRPTLLFAVVLNTIKSFQVFTEIYVMTRGGPLNKTTTLVYGVYENAFEKADEMGYACAIAYVLFFIIALFSAAETRFIKGKTA